MRTCGPCQLCCKVFPVPILGKAENESCRFLSASGCSIHDRGRPEICGAYACYWLDHEDVPDEQRPDRIGMVVTECGAVTVSGEVLPVLVVNQAEAEACQSAQSLIDNLVALGYALLVIYGLDMRIVYDRCRWPSVSDAEIEAAFRRERSRDAEELKRLGAVEQDYGPCS
jgi:hypothetical protein